MAENVQPASNSGGGVNGDLPGYAHYEKQRQCLKELLHNRKVIERQLVAQEQSILQKETEYLENTPYGNIITGFDGYIKGTTNPTALRKRTGVVDQNRVFSRSSISHNPSHPDHVDANSATSTPAAPTPISTSFAKDKEGSSNQPTPTSATEKKGGSKKKKARKEVDEDSEMDSREVKKVRTNFGGSRK